MMLKEIKIQQFESKQETAKDTLFFLVDSLGSICPGRALKVRIRTSPEVFKGGVKEKNAMAVYMLISIRWKHKCVYGETRTEIAKKLGISKYLLSSAISILTKKGLLTERTLGNKVIIEVRSIRKLNRGSKGHLKPLFFYIYDSFDVIKNKIFSFSVKHVITSQLFIHKRVEPKYRCNDVSELKTYKKYVKKYGKSDSPVATIGIRRLAKRLGVSMGKMSKKINEMVNDRILTRKKIFEILDGTKNSRFLLNHYSYTYKWSLIQLIGTNYSIISNRLYTQPLGANPSGGV